MRSKVDRQKRFSDLANRFGTEAAQRIVDAEFAEELDLENHEGIQRLKAWREDERFGRGARGVV